MLQDHPTIEELEGFLQDPSRRGHSARNAKVLRHLLADCRACHGRLEALGWPKSRLERLVYLPGGMQEGESGLQRACTSNGYNYDRAFARVEQVVEEFLTAAPPPALLPAQLLQELDQHPF